MSLFSNSAVLIPISLSVLLFVWQLWLCLRTNRWEHADLIPFTFPLCLFLFAFAVWMFDGGLGRFLNMTDVLTFMIALAGVWLLIVIGAAWLTAHLIQKFRK